MLGNLLVRFSFGAQLADSRRHLVGGGELCQGADRDGPRHRGGVAAFPKDPGLNELTRRTMDDHLLKETPQQRVRVLWRDERCRPDLGQLVPTGGKGLPQLGRQGKGPYRWWLVWYGGGFSVFERPQGGFPTVFPRGGDQAVLGIATAALARRQGRLGPKPLQGVRVVNVPLGLLLGCPCAGIDLEFEG